MSILRAIPDIESWLDNDAESWCAVSDAEYKALVRRWSETFAPLVAADAKCTKGGRAMVSLEARFPTDLTVISGLQVPELCNTGGRGPAAFRAQALMRVERNWANRMELILVADDFSWACVFSHEAGAFVWEQFYVLPCSESDGQPLS
jgi:hypothetical protein